jgi:23S rRNA pseudouridine1911/1915/1917 synthase
MVEILYDLGPCLVVNKPAGVLTQAPRGIESMETLVKEFYRQREGIEPGANMYLGLAHRIDRPVTGALAFARHVRAARKLCSQFANRTVSKVYWAFVEGHLAPEEGTWTDYLHKRDGMAQAEVVGSDHPAAKHAVLHYRVQWQSEIGSWLEIQLETGRTHQIRIQSASRGHPVLGDAQYGSTSAFGRQHDDIRCRAIALHARQLGFNHPMTGDPIDITAPLSTDWDVLELPI